MSPSTKKDNLKQWGISLTLILIVLNSACTSNSIKQETEISAPSWYQNLSAQQGRIIGYGRGSDPRTFNVVAVRIDNKENTGDALLAYNSHQVLDK
mgnify:CR=1 FL=1|jgi:hypothetical protein